MYTTTHTTKQHNRFAVCYRSYQSSAVLIAKLSGAGSQPYLNTSAAAASQLWWEEFIHCKVVLLLISLHCFCTGRHHLWETLADKCGGAGVGRG